MVKTPETIKFWIGFFLEDFPSILSVNCMWYLKQDGVDELVINKLFVCWYGPMIYYCVQSFVVLLGDSDII